jgi:hypothetical protein
MDIGRLRGDQQLLVSTKTHHSPPSFDPSSFRNDDRLPPFAPPGRPAPHSLETDRRFRMQTALSGHSRAASSVS